MKLTLPKISDKWTAHGMRCFDKIITNISSDINFRYINGESNGEAGRIFKSFYTLAYEYGWKKL